MDWSPAKIGAQVGQPKLLQEYALGVEIVMKQNPQPNLDQLDLMILREMGLDGRRPISDLAKKLGISRVYAGRRLQRLLDQQSTRIVAFTNPLVLGYQTVAIIGIQVLPNEINKAANKLSELPNINLVITTAGRHDIVIWTMFHSPADLSEFLGRELGTVSGIISTEAMIVLEMRKLSFSFVTAYDLGDGGNHPQPETAPIQYFTPALKIDVDRIDLMILKEMESNARQSVSDLAKKLRMSRAHASGRLQRLLDQQLTRIVAFTNPLILGYNFFSLIGIKALPGEIDAAADKLSTFANVFMVAKTAGQHDVIVWAVFKTPLDLSTFIMNELAGISGITSTETIIALELRKMDFTHLASSLSEESTDGH